MIPIPLQDEPIPPLKVTRTQAFASLADKRFELVVVGPTPIAREIARLASHNSISTAYLCVGDFVDTDTSNHSPCRLPISEILSARYDGAVDLNHVEILAVSHFRDAEVQIVCRCLISNATTKFICGALINETGQRIGAVGKSAKRPDPLPRWFNAVIEEQSAVFKFYPGRLKTLTTSSAAELILSSVFKAGGAKVGKKIRTIAKLTSVPLIDSRSQLIQGSRQSSGVKKTLNEFISTASQHGVNDAQISQAIQRFGTRVAHLMLLPNWFEPIHPLMLRGEFHLSLATELPRDLAELLECRLDFEEVQTVTQEATVELDELFRELQKF